MEPIIAPLELLPTNFTALDWGIVAIYLSGALAVGLLANRYIHTSSAYIIGGGASGTSLNIATFIGSGLGLVTLMYASIDGFSNGFAYVTLAILWFVVGIILGSTGLVIGRLRKMNLFTIQEFFEKRFSRRTRILAGTICVISGVLNMGLFPKMGATFITYATGMGGENAEVTVNIITTILIVMVLVYTVLGGMVSVIITDYVQFIILSIGMGLGVYFCLTHPALGWDTMTQTLAEARGERMFNPVAEGGYGWTWIIFMSLVGFTAGFCWAPEATRALTARNSGVARRTFLLGSPGLFVRLGIPTLWGVAAFTLAMQTPELQTYFFPDGVTEGAQNASHAMPMTLGYIVPAGLLGVLVAGLMAAFMSTHDSYFLCWASVFTRDVVGPMRRIPMGQKEEISLIRISVVVIGVFLLVWGLWYPLPDSVWDYMAVTGTIYLSGASVSLLGGLYWKRASEAGALAGMLLGLVAIAGLFLEPVNERLAPLLPQDYELRMVEVGLFTFALCAVGFVVFSLLLPDRDDKGGAEQTAAWEVK